ncbi:MAG: hypothetical protein HW421_3829 [Ignavibacteria bacterium]|nr:hypothetical protein [Ignavibacteria bacterium]
MVSVILSYVKNFIILLLVVFCMISVESQAQRIAGPDGEQVLRNCIFSTTVGKYRFAVTRYSVYFAKQNQNNAWEKAKEVYTTPLNLTFSDAIMKSNETGNTRTLSLLRSDGSVVLLSYNSDVDAMSGSPIIIASDGLPTGSFRRLFNGQKFYLISGNNIYTNKNDGTPWKPDSIGLSRQTLRDISLDISGNLIAATNKGLFIKNNGNDTFKLSPAFDTVRVNILYIGRSGKYLLYAYNTGVYSSSDFGSTWKIDTAVIGRQSVTRFGDDAAGNVYAIVSSLNTPLVYKKSANESAWVRIDTNLKNFIGIAPNINDIGGLNTADVATTYGSFSSSDIGISWINSSNGIQAEDHYGLQFLSGGKMVTSTNLGIFSKAGPTNDWIKTFPANAYSASRPLFKDNTGNIYTQAAASGTIQQPIYKSTDAGITWMPDTLGLSTVPVTSGGFFQSVFYVDENGGEHFGLPSVTTPSPTAFRLYAKSQGSSFATDTAGIGISLTSSTQTFVVNSFGTNYRGSLYFSGLKYNQQFTIVASYIYKKNPSTAPWTLDTAGIGLKQVNAFTANKNGTMYAGSAVSGGVSHVFLKEGATWKNIPAPPASSVNVSSMGCDSMNSIYAVFANSGFQGTSNKGVYATADTGKTWQYAGMDSLLVRGLTARSDSIFAFTGRGIYRLNKTALKLPKMVLVPKTLDFGKVKTNTQKDLVVKVSNLGQDTLRVTNISNTGGVINVSSRNFKVAPGADYNLTVSYKPTTLGILQTVLRISSNDFPDSIVCNGEGILPDNPAKISFNTRTINFDSVKVSTTKDTVVVVENQGGDTLRISNITSSRSGFTIPVRVFNIVPGAKQNITISFRPTDTIIYQGYIRFISNIMQDSISVLGKGWNIVAIAPNMILDFHTLNFGKVEIGKEGDTILRITNPPPTGTDTLNVTDIRSSDTSIFKAYPTAFNVLVDYGQYVTFRFLPKQKGIVNGKYTIISNDSPDSVLVTGEGIDPSGVDENITGFNETMNIKLSPNPNSGLFNIFIENLLPNERILHFAIYDELGNMTENIFSGFVNAGMTVHPVNLGLMPSGI